jgi:hypothetical protein
MFHRHILEREDKGDGAIFNPRGAMNDTIGAAQTNWRFGAETRMPTRAVSCIQKDFDNRHVTTDWSGPSERYRAERVTPFVPPFYRSRAQRFTPRGV